MISIFFFYLDANLYIAAAAAVEVRSTGVFKILKSDLRAFEI